LGAGAWWSKERTWPSTLLLPTFILGLTSLGRLSRYMRSACGGDHQDFIRAAEAKAKLLEGVRRPALRNALIPHHLFGLMLPDLYRGGVIIRNELAYPGMGRLGYEAIMRATITSSWRLR